MSDQLWVTCKINISVIDILVYFNQYYFTNLSRLECHGFHTLIEISNLAPKHKIVAFMLKTFAGEKTLCDP